MVTPQKVVTFFVDSIHVKKLSQRWDDFPKGGHLFWQKVKRFRFLPRFLYTFPDLEKDIIFCRLFQFRKFRQFFRSFFKVGISSKNLRESAKFQFLVKNFQTWKGLPIFCQKVKGFNSWQDFLSRFPKSEIEIKNITRHH